jgi:ubiquinone/menaquinone biosynthesis C-methylase UbiE
MPTTRTLACTAVLLAAVSAPTAGQLKQQPAATWTERLERPERVEGLRIPYIISSLALKPGDIVADIGAGPGVLSLPLAKAVPSGRVYAVDIDQAFLDHIKEKAATQHVTNVVPVLGEHSDPKLPTKDVDVALFHDVLHHIEDRAGYLRSVASYLKPGGRIAIIELPPTGSHKDEPALVVTKDQVKAWLGDAGFKPVQEFDGLAEGKWFVVYARQ